MLVLVLGNLNIPSGAISIPKEFQKLLIPGKIQQIISCGNRNYKSTDIIDFLKNISSDLVLVDGQFDIPNLAESRAGSAMSEFRVVSVGQFRIGVINGYQLTPWNDIEAQSMFCRMHNLNVLVSSNCFSLSDAKQGQQGTTAGEYEGVFHLSPGSITSSTNPSFALLDISPSSPTLNAFIYHLVQTPGGGAPQVKVEKVEFSLR